MNEESAFIIDRKLTNNKDICFNIQATKNIVYGLRVKIHFFALE